MMPHATPIGHGAEPTHDAVDVSKFVYVDLALGSVENRNHPVRIDQIPDVVGKTDCYASHNRTTSDLLDWVRTHRNKKGNRTVAKFDGPVWAPDLHLDFDAKTDPALAQVALRQVLSRLAGWGVDLKTVAVFYSGSKGFHAELPHSLFGGFAPSVDFHKQLKRAATEIMGDIPFDRVVYDKLRLWRLPNTVNSGTGLYKIPLSSTEALSLPIDEIKALATQPRLDFGGGR
jgi:hypothetical protein